MGVKEEDLERMDAIQKESAEIVKADFDEIGSLIENKSVPGKEFLKRYWLEVLKSWTVLCDEIQKIRQIDPNYMENFGKVKRRAEGYRKGENGKQPQVVKDIIIAPGVENFKLEKLPLRDLILATIQEYKISLFFDIPIVETKDIILTLKDYQGNEITNEASWDRDNNAIVITFSPHGVEPFELKIDKVQDTKSSRMEEAYTKSFRLPQ